MTKIIDGQEMLNLLAQARDDRAEDYKYQDDHEGEACRYVRDGAPACIVGVALITHAGLEWPVYTDTTDPDRIGQPVNGSISNRRLLAEVERLNDVEFTDNAAWVAQIAQAYQDTGETWATAVAEAGRKVVAE